MQTLRPDQPDFWQRLGAFARGESERPDVRDAVTALLADVRKRGDAALIEHTRRLDRAELTPATLQVDPAELSAAAEDLPTDTRAAIEEAIHCVRVFHEEGRPHDWAGRNPHGAEVGERHYPLRRVGLYVPGGQVPLVSTVIMTAVPARLAGCPEIAVFTPPRPDGSIDPGILAALHLCGIDEVYRLGGVLAVGAAAYGTATVKAVDKIFGPGNAYTIEAKRQVFGTVGIDLLPGPSEVMVIADHTGRADWIAADLLAQAEHGSGKERVYFVTTDPDLPAAVAEEAKAQAGGLTHAAAIRRALETGTAIIRVPDLETAAAVADFVAPEHLELHVERSAERLLLDRITTAGAILLGPHTPTVLGDFTAGPSHTLPTGRSGRFLSGLRLPDFYRRTSLIRYEPEHLPAAAPIIATFAALEQLDAHGTSLRRRLEP